MGASIGTNNVDFDPQAVLHLVQLPQMVAFLNGQVVTIDSPHLHDSHFFWKLFEQFYENAELEQSFGRVVVRLHLIPKNCEVRLGCKYLIVFSGAGATLNSREVSLSEWIPVEEGLRQVVKANNNSAAVIEISFAEEVDLRAILPAALRHPDMPFWSRKALTKRYNKENPSEEELKKLLYEHILPIAEKNQKSLYLDLERSRQEETAIQFLAPPSLADRSIFKGDDNKSWVPRVRLPLHLEVLLQLEEDVDAGGEDSGKGLCVFRRNDGAALVLRFPRAAESIAPFFAEDGEQDNCQENKTTYFMRKGDAVSRNWLDVREYCKACGVFEGLFTIALLINHQCLQWLDEFA